MGDNTGNDMASLILAKECELEVSMAANKPPQAQFKKMQTLLQIYSQAIEYYQSVESELYIDLNLRMQNLLTRPDILEMIDIHTGKGQASACSKEESIQEEKPQKRAKAPSMSPKNYTARPERKTEENRSSESPETRDSSILFEHLNDQGEDHPDEEEDDQPFGRSTFCLKDLNSLADERSNLRATCTGVAQFDVDDHSNEFVYHKNDGRNRHGVSFKVCKDKKDGALVRPKLICKNQEKGKIHSELLNENNEELNSLPIVEASKKVVEEYNEERQEGETISSLEQNIREQESALKIRLLKREAMLAKKKQLNTSQSDSFNSSSNQQSSFETSPKF
ncbi:unnamed protein product [Moneuplotes crassus]|uniref:Uncharacterized protein n=1 Tax=Euplotes crassus TaxID=5936 RepID=A0AAD1XI08_EUPCR|nr:unnamed protein product [Moneuplotes crassus]